MSIGESVRRSRRIFAFGALGLLLALPAAADQVFFDDFNSGANPAWSDTTTDVTPSGGRRFLGQFGNQTITLTLTGLPAHTDLLVSFSLFLIRSWDGNFSYVGGSGDAFQFGVQGGAPVLDATFGTHFQPGHPSGVVRWQSHPDPLGGGPYLPQTDAAEVNALGYLCATCGSFNSEAMSSVYNFLFRIPHSAGSATLLFRGLTDQSLTDESWGLDNVQIETLVPEPATFVLFGLGAGLVWFGARRRWKARG